MGALTTESTELEQTWKLGYKQVVNLLNLFTNFQVIF